MNPGHNYTIPANEQIAAIMRQLWMEQYAVMKRAIDLYGRPGLLRVHLDQWKPALIERLLPIYRTMVAQGKVSFDQHTRVKSANYSVKRGAAIEMIAGIPKQRPMVEMNEYIEVTDPNVEELARRYLYDFADSTLATSKYNVLEVYQRTQNILGTGLGRGDTLDQITHQIGTIFQDPYRASMVAASESSRLYHGGQLITAKESGEVHGKQWLASSDACERCLELNGKTIPLDEPFEVKAGRYGTVMHPPLHPFCLLEKTPVGLASLIAATHAKYNGPIVRLHFDDGSSVGVTPNHMLFSSLGFLRAADFVQGDDVICASGCEVNTFLPARRSPNNNYAPATALEIFHSLREAESMTACSVPVSPEYLHGDAAFCNGKVDVVRPDGFLGYTTDTTFSQPFEHLPLALADMFRSIQFVGGGNLVPLLSGLFFATERSVGRSRELLALLRGKSRIAKEMSLAPGSDLESKLAKAESDYASAHVESLRNTLDTFAGMVTRLKIIKIDYETVHDTPVYDFETRETMYLVGNGIISSNCMCSLTYELIPSAREQPQAAHEELPDMKPGQWQILLGRQVA